MDLDTNSDEFKQAVEEAVAAEVAGLKKTSGALKGEKRALAEQLSETQKRLDAYAEEEEERARKVAVKKGDWDKLESSLREQHAKEIEVREGRISALDRSLRSEILEKRAIEHIAAAGGSAKVLKPHVISALSIHEDDGQFQAVVVDEKGAPRLKADAKTATDYMTVGEYVESLKSDPEFAGCFSGTGASGGGASTSKDRGGRSSPKTISSTDPLALGKYAEKIASGEVEVI